MNEFPSSIRKVSDIKPQSEVVETAHHVFFNNIGSFGECRIEAVYPRNGY
jgi:hypothetical protein